MGMHNGRELKGVVIERLDIGSTPVLSQLA